MQNNIWSVNGEKNMSSKNDMFFRIDLYEKGNRLGMMPKHSHSVKSVDKDHLGRDVDVLWMANKDFYQNSITPNKVYGFKLTEVRHLSAYEQLGDDEIYDHLSHSLFSLGTTYLPVEALLHAFLPFKHIDYVYPEAVVSIACSSNGKEVCERLWGDSVIWIEETLPGFVQSKALKDAVENFPKAKLAVIANNALITWGETSQECYENTTKFIKQAEDFISSQITENQPAEKVIDDNVTVNDREEIITRILPWLRGTLSRHSTKILAFDDSDDVMRFINNKSAGEMSQIGASTPAQLEFTKPLPLFVNWQPDTGVEKLKSVLAEKIDKFQKAYEKYFNAFAREDEKMGDSLPNIILISGLGMIASGINAQQADDCRNAYRHTIEIIKNSSAVDEFVGLNPGETFNAEYRSNKSTTKLSKMSSAEFDSKVVVITGAASGIGRGTALRMAREGGHIAILDLNLEGGQEVAAEINQKYSSQMAVAYKCDVGDEDIVQDVFKKIIRQYGGIDIVVNNAGIAYGAPIEQTSLKDWNLVQKVLTTGYFLISREAFRVWREQDIGGVMVIVGSKNSIRAGKNIVAYSAAKAAELHMARCLAEEGGEAGIRVNSVLPDAVLKGASIFTDELREARAKSYGIEPDQLEDYYIQRTTLKVPVYPEHIAEAIAFLASDRASRTTGGVITVDGGVNTAYVR